MGSSQENENISHLQDFLLRLYPSKKRKSVKIACTHCRRLHKSCSSERPCRRCVARGLSHLCRDEAPKKRVGKFWNTKTRQQVAEMIGHHSSSSDSLSSSSSSSSSLEYIYGTQINEQNRRTQASSIGNHFKLWSNYTHTNNSSHPSSVANSLKYPLSSFSRNEKFNNNKNSNKNNNNNNSKYQMKTLHFHDSSKRFSEKYSDNINNNDDQQNNSSPCSNISPKPKTIESLEKQSTEYKNNAYPSHDRVSLNGHKTNRKTNQKNNPDNLITSDPKIKSRTRSNDINLTQRESFHLREIDDLDIPLRFNENSSLHQQHHHYHHYHHHHHHHLRPQHHHSIDGPLDRTNKTRDTTIKQSNNRPISSTIFENTGLHRTRSSSSSNIALCTNSHSPIHDIHHPKRNNLQTVSPLFQFSESEFEEKDSNSSSSLSSSERSSNSFEDNNYNQFKTKTTTRATVKPPRVCNRTSNNDISSNIVDAASVHSDASSKKSSDLSNRSSSSNSSSSSSDSSNNSNSSSDMGFEIDGNRSPEESLEEPFPHQTNNSINSQSRLIVSSISAKTDQSSSQSSETDKVKISSLVN